MRCIALGLIGVMLLGLASTLQADDTDAEKAFKSYAELVVGGILKTTTVATKVVDGKMTLTDKKADLINEYRPFGSGKFLRLITNRNGQNNDSITVLGIDPASKKFTWWSFGKWGVGISTTIQEEEGVWIGEWTNTNQEGQLISIKSRFSAVGKDQILAERTEVIVDGEKMDIVTPDKTWTRHKGTITAEPISTVTDKPETNAETDAERAFAAYGEVMIGGVWKTISKKAELVNGVVKPTGEESETAHQYRWFAGKRFLELSETEDGEKTDSIMVMGVDPKTDKFTWWTFGEKGVGTITFTPEGDNAFLIQTQFTDDQGIKGVWKAKVKLGQDECHLSDIEASLDGNPVPLLDTSSVWTRHEE